MLMRYLEFQPAFAGSVCECLDLAVIRGAAPVENNGRDTSGFGLFGKSHTEGFRTCDIRLQFLLAQNGIEAREKDERGASVVVDRLGINVLGGEAN